MVLLLLLLAHFCMSMLTPDFHALFDRYTTFLRVERNASVHTLRNYQSDLLQFTAFIEEGSPKVQAHAVGISQIDHHCIHAFLSALHRQHKKSSIGRKLSALKSFFHFLLREGVIE